MKVTIVPDDKCVIMNGDARMDLDFAIDPAIHAIQWYETWGEIEYKTQLVNGEVVKPANEIIQSLNPFQSALDAWTNCIIPETEPADPSPPTPVKQVTARQARLVLFQDGLLAKVESLVISQGGATQIEWEYAIVIDRDSPLTQSIASELGLSPEQIQSMFDRASVL